MSEIVLTHDEFIQRYTAGEILVYVDKNKAGDLILSDHADKHYKPAHLFWSWGGILLVTIVPITLLFIKWWLTILSFIIGAFIMKYARKSAAQFVIQNMLESEDFWDYTLLHGGAEIYDGKNNPIISTTVALLRRKAIRQE